MKPDCFERRHEAKLRPHWDAHETREYIRTLACWEGEIEIRQHFGGLRNRTYFATDADGRKYAVRCGFDEGRVRQASSAACARAAASLGVSPAVRYVEPNVLITDFIDGPKVTREALEDPDLMAHVIERLKVLHRNPQAVTESVNFSWTFHTVRRYLDIVEKRGTREDWREDLPRLREVVERLERAIGPYHPTFTHNDTAYVNLIFGGDGQVYLLDWDGGGFGHPAGELGEMLMWLDSDEAMDRHALRCYFGGLSESDMETKLHEHRAFKIIAALRLVTECMEIELNRNRYLSEEEMRIGMQAFFVDQEPRITGLIDMLYPVFEGLWAKHRDEYP